MECRLASAASLPITSDNSRFHVMTLSGLIEKTVPRATGIKSGSFSPARVARMHAALRRHVDSGEVPGLVAAVSCRHREHAEAIGTMSFGSETPIQRDSLFRLASTTQPVTAVAALLLVEECRL